MIKNTMKINTKSREILANKQSLDVAYINKTIKWNVPTAAIKKKRGKTILYSTYCNMLNYHVRLLQSLSHSCCYDVYVFCFFLSTGASAAVISLPSLSCLLSSFFTTLVSMS